MKIILLETVKNVGKKGEVKEVADGYGRNYLVKNGLAVEYTKKSAQILQQQKDEDKAKQDQLKKEAEEVKAQLDKLTLKFNVKAGADGKMFGSVSPKLIAEKLSSEYGIQVDKRKFVKSENITAIGKHDVQIELYKGVIATVHLDVSDK